MSETLQNQSNADSILSNSPVNDIQEEMMKVKIEEKKEEGDYELRQLYPDRPGEPDCTHYLRFGYCAYASNCRYHHPPRDPLSDENKRGLPQREGQPDCGHYVKTGTCKYGMSCKYHHPLDRGGAAQVKLNSLGLPLREQEKPCPFYVRNKTCKYGPVCKFDHPPPASDETDVPVSKEATVGMGSALPSSSLPYAGALTAWPWTRSQYVAPPRSSDTQTYMPYFIPPFQGAVTAQNWYSHPGNKTAATNLIGADLVNSTRNPGEVVNGWQVDFGTMANSNLPDRPDQPECRYFISTGNCKYGTSCKFHHPKEKIAHCIGPHGLPLRPGVDICNHFSLYGSCKYGPTCKFNHPLIAYFYSYCYFGMPVPNQPFIPSQWNMSVSISTETSQSKSPKITDWIQKPENLGGKSHPQAVIKPIEDSNEQVDDQSNAASAPTSEVTKDHSD